MQRSDDQRRKLFDNWAASYDADVLREGGPLTGYAESMQQFTAALPDSTAAHVLDIGIGGGALASRLAERGATITGIDISQKMLDVCAEKYPDFDLHIGTFTHIPAPDAAFDGVVAGFAFHEVLIAERRVACDEMARVLKPGGYVCIVDIMFASAAATQAAKAVIGRAWDDEEDYALVGDLDTPLRAAGFTGVSWVQTGLFHWMVMARKA